MQRWIIYLCPKLYLKPNAIQNFCNTYLDTTSKADVPKLEFSDTFSIHSTQQKNYFYSFCNNKFPMLLSNVHHCTKQQIRNHICVAAVIKYSDTLKYSSTLQPKPGSFLAYACNVYRANDGAISLLMSVNSYMHQPWSTMYHK